MTGRSQHDPRVEIRPASPDQKPVVANLLQLYVHDFSEFIDCEIGPDGRFGYKDLDQYWTDPARVLFFIYVSGKLAGFLLVQGVSKGEARVWDMAEFFILRGYRRRSIGMRAAAEAFAHFPGDWQVRVMAQNQPACAFWDRAVRAFAGEVARVDRRSANGKQWNVYSFNSRSVR